MLRTLSLPHNFPSNLEPSSPALPDPLVTCEPPAHADFIILAATTGSTEDANQETRFPSGTRREIVSEGKWVS